MRGKNTELDLDRNDFWKSQTDENLTSLAPQHPILSDKHNNQYLNNGIEDSMWFEISKQLG